MSITAENSADKQGRGRAWLVAGLGMLVLPLVVPVVLFAQPRSFYFDGHVLLIGNSPAPVAGRSGPALSWWYSRDIPAPPRPDSGIEGMRDGRFFYINGGHVRGLCIGGRVFTVGWFRGRPYKGRPWRPP